jgi:hypothetical protein
MLASASDIWTRSVALTAQAPSGLVAAISFAGGRGSRDDDDVCNPDGLVQAFATFGKTSRVPMLWVYATNDLFFGPDLARRLGAPSKMISRDLRHGRPPAGVTPLPARRPRRLLLPEGLRATPVPSRAEAPTIRPAAAV